MRKRDFPVLRAVVAAGSEEQLFRHLEEWLGHGIPLSPVSLEFDGDLTFEEWSAVLEKLVKFHAASNREYAWLRSLRPCLHCNRVLPEGATKRRQYCSEACRLAAHRRRHAGMPPSAPKQRGRKLA
jgi:hypothetical protein